MASLNYLCRPHSAALKYGCKSLSQSQSQPSSPILAQWRSLPRQPRWWQQLHCLWPLSRPELPSTTPKTPAHILALCWPWTAITAVHIFSSFGLWEWVLLLHRFAWWVYRFRSVWCVCLLFICPVIPMVIFFYFLISFSRLHLLSWTPHLSIAYIY